MFTALYSTSQALSRYLRSRLESLPPPGLGFGGGGSRQVTINSPKEMRDEMKVEGLSVWLYRVDRDEMRLNLPDRRVSTTLLQRPPLPLRLHYLMTAITFEGGHGGSPEIEQKILGRVMQSLHTRPILRGADLTSTDFEGSDAELHVMLEALSLDEIARVWESLEGPQQLVASYQVSVVNVDAELQPERVVPVSLSLPEVATDVVES